MAATENNNERLLSKLKKPKTQRGKRILKERGPQLVENSKFSLVLAGRNCSNEVALLLRDLYALRKPSASFVRLRSEEIRPLEDETQIERFTRKSNAGLFLSGSHSKKRPVNLVFGRIFDGNMLDLAEFRVLAHKLAGEFESSISLGTKPCIAINGSEFETNPVLSRIKNIFIDFFHGDDVEKIRLAGMEHLISISHVDNVIYIRSYRILLQKSGSRLPKVELEEVGPRLDLALDRHRFASDALWKQATRTPSQLKSKKLKNVSKDIFGSTVGQLHVEHQDLGHFTAGKRVKALRKRNVGDETAEGEAPRGKRTKKAKIAKPHSIEKMDASLNDNAN